MSDTPENSSVSPKLTSKLVDAAVKLHRRLKGKLTFRLPYELEWKLQYACLMLAGTPNAANTWQSMIEKALTNHFESLEKKGIVTFPPVPQPTA
jgi:hypothetical protein